MGNSEGQRSQQKRWPEFPFREDYAMRGLSRNMPLKGDRHLPQPRLGHLALVKAVPRHPPNFVAFGAFGIV